MLSKQSFLSGSGTPFTMAPEVLEGKYYPASDMFSWGITMCCAVVQAMDGVADPLDFYSANRESLVTRAVSIVIRHRAPVAELLSRCYSPSYLARPSASDALGIVYAARISEAPVQPTGPAPVSVPVYDVVTVVEVMESLGIAASGVIDTLGGTTAVTVEELRTPGGVSVSNVVKIRRALPPQAASFKSAVVCTHFCFVGRRP